MAEREAAARVALALAEDHYHRLARSVAQGWLQRAERDLEGLAETATHGWLERLRMLLALEVARDLQAAMRHAERVLEIARRTGDTDLEALAIQDRGRILVTLGQVADGMALIDDSMTFATSGELTPRTAGRTYCNMISTCERLGDYGRAAEWNEAAHRWTGAHADSVFPGICRVHQAGHSQAAGLAAGGGAGSPQGRGGARRVPQGHRRRGLLRAGTRSAAGWAIIRAPKRCTARRTPADGTRSPGWPCCA